MANLFFSYSHFDLDVRDKLEKSFSVLIDKQIVIPWHDRRMEAGVEFDPIIMEKLNNSDIILLLMTTSFFESKYCRDIEMPFALKMHREGRARVIPILVNHCQWHYYPKLTKLNILPSRDKAIRDYSNRDKSFTEIANEIGLIAFNINKGFVGNIKNTLYDAPNSSYELLITSKLIYKFVSENIRAIGTVLILLTIAILFLSSRIEKNPDIGRYLDKTYNNNTGGNSVEEYWNYDSNLDKAVIVEEKREGDLSHGLYIFTTENNKVKLTEYKEGFSWFGANENDDLWLSVNKKQSLEVNSSSFFPDFNDRKITIAYRNSNFVVAGYTYTQGQDASVKCDINFLSGIYIVNGDKQKNIKSQTPLNEWSIGNLPFDCL